MRATDRCLISIMVLVCALAAAAAGELPKSLLDFYASEAKASDPAFSGFSAERGEHLFRTNFSTGKPDTPSCTTCHTTDPRKTGKPARARTSSRWRPRRIQIATAIKRKQKNGSDATATAFSAETAPRRKRVTSLRLCCPNEFRGLHGSHRRFEVPAAKVGRACSRRGLALLVKNPRSSAKGRFDGCLDAVIPCI